MIVEELSIEEEKSWEEFVDTFDDATFFHKIGWRNLIENVYGFKPIYLFAKDSRQVQAVVSFSKGYETTR